MGQITALLTRLLLVEQSCQQQLIVAAVCKRSQDLLLGLQGIFLHCGIDFPLCRLLFCMIVLYYLLFSFTIEISILIMEMIELTVKDAVLQALEQARGTRLSGGTGWPSSLAYPVRRCTRRSPHCARAALPLTP